MAPVPAPAATVTRPARRTETAWLSISRASVELGVIELRPGLRGVFTLASSDAASRELQKAWAKLDRPEGIAVDLHLPPESGKGRGPYGSKIVKPGGDGYALAVEQKLEAAEYYVERVPALAPSEALSSIRTRIAQNCCAGCARFRGYSAWACTMGSPRRRGGLRSGCWGRFPGIGSRETDGREPASRGAVEP